MSDDRVRNVVARETLSSSVEDGFCIVGWHGSFSFVPELYVFSGAGSARDICTHVGKVRGSYAIGGSL